MAKSVRNEDIIRRICPLLAGGALAGNLYERKFFRHVSVKRNVGCVADKCALWVDDTGNDGDNGPKCGHCGLLK